jgi:hypothetical protein
MKMFQLLAVLTACAGCAPIQPLVLSNPVGPLQSFADESRTGGSLVVYSETDGRVLDPADYPPHSDYQVYTLDGQRIWSVTNRDSISAREPATLELPVGQYKVTAKVLKIGFVTVPVVIEKDRTTVVDLNADVLPHSLAANEKWVSLPNGQIIGSKSK